MTRKAAQIARRTTIVSPKPKTSAGRRGTVERATRSVGKTGATIDFVRSIRRS
jgi:hypothetical protein